MKDFSKMKYQINLGAAELTNVPFNTREHLCRETNMNPDVAVDLAVVDLMIEDADVESWLRGKMVGDVQVKSPWSTLMR